MHRILIVVDMQNDFIDGSLGTPEAVSILPNVIDKVRAFDGEVVFTLDTHGEDYFETQEGRKLPVKHCIKGTTGWELPRELERLCHDLGGVRFEKPTFGSTELARYLVALHQSNPIDGIVVIGLCTDICVVSNALMIKAHLPEVPVEVDSACCAGVTPAKHAAALETMRSCQIDVV